ncbi:PAS domain-containing sensor histidine kinase [Chryseolinea lacunae]|uniref:histidine kinase n=1 Tax=Chryseolinea lacunae TaxID=2801331 RepID=A0ABS1KQK1_9BACT|nr:PAS domain S-box protein [Chryseolinea lacunae]MBL0741749.1 PAS domain-containing sensor histidine kinase [Chryseolinea lacunae]
MKQKQTHELNAQSFRALIEHAHEGIVIYDLKGRIRFASAGVKKIAGYQEAELLGKSGKTFLHPHDAVDAAKAFDKLLPKPGKSITILQRIRHKKGHYFWSESTLTNFAHLPEIKGVVSNFRDVTEKLKADEAAQQSRELLETINRNVSEGIFMGILGTRFIYVNDAFVKMMGYRSANELLKKNFSDLFPAKHDYNKCRKLLEQVSVLKDKEMTFHRKNGDKFCGILNISLLKHEGKHDQFVGSIRDITREKKVELDLLESRNFLKNTVDTVAAPLFVKDHRHRWVMMNEQFCRLIGRTKKEMTGKTDRDFLSAAEAKVFWNIDNAVLKTGKTIVNQERITSAKEGVRDLLTVKSRYVNERGEAYIIGFITDITAVNEVKERMSELNANLRGVMESTRESIYAVDTKLRYITFNENHKRVMKLLYGCTIKPGDDMMKLLRPSPDSVWIHEEILKAVNGNIFVSEHYLQYPKYKGYIQTTYNPIRDENNQVKGVAVFVKEITERKRFEHIIQSINANLHAVMESTADRILAVDMKFRYIMFNRPHADSIKRLFNKDLKEGDNILKVLPPELAKIARREITRAMKGKQFSIETQIPNMSILETTYNPIYDEHKGITGVALFIRNVTERKRIEEQMKSLNEELMQQNFQLAAQEEELKATLEELSERNFELDQLMYKTSHDLRSPLSSIMGLVNLAHLDRDPESRDNYLAKIEGRIKKLDEFIRSMLDYARVNRVEVAPEYIDLQMLVQNSLRELEYLDNFAAVHADVQVKNKVPFKSDALRVKVIFSNIISNAYKYFNPDVQSFLSIRIEVTATQARIDFRDNGIGIKPEYMNKIFNMFYRATDRSQGSGLGMYIVKQAVEKLNGTIAIDSEYAKGTHIVVTLPNRGR